MKSAANDTVRISKRISFLLRHSTEFIDSHGWAEVSAIIAEIQKRCPDFNMDDLREIVVTDAKGRYSFDETGTKIRANQGHSVPVDVELREAEPPEVLYHGTATRFLPSILNEGLTGRTRLYVHLSATAETARQVGARHGEPVVLRIAAGRMRSDGYRFFLSENHVWLTKHVPARYIEPAYDL